MLRIEHPSRRAAVATMAAKSEPFEGKVSAEWLEKSVPLSQAWRQFGEPMFLAKLREVEEEFRALAGFHPDGLIPAPTDALDVEWRTGLDEDDAVKALEMFRAYQRWQRHAQHSIKSAILTQKLVPIGRPQFVGADYQKIEFDEWMNLKEDTTTTDVFRAENSVYWSVRVVDPSAVSEKFENETPAFAQMPARQPPASNAMVAALDELLAEGKFFRTATEAHSAVMHRLGIKEAPRGFSYKRFQAIAAERLKQR